LTKTYHISDLIIVMIRNQISKLALLGGTLFALQPNVFAQTGTAATGTAPSAPCKTEFTDPQPKGNPGMWVTSEDYPSNALRNEHQGRVTVRFYVTAEGRIESAEVVDSTATPELDAATIKNVTRRGRFNPATRKCVPVPGEFTRSFNWLIPRD
jgi:periplasmic protein TonB